MKTPISYTLFVKQKEQFDAHWKQFQVQTSVPLRQEHEANKTNSNVLDLITMSFWREAVTGKIAELSVGGTDKLCICPLLMESETRDAVEAAAKVNAAAVIVAGKAPPNAKLPVFVLPPEAVDRLCKLKNVIAFFRWNSEQGDRVLEERASNSYNVTAQSSHSTQDSKADGSKGYEERTNHDSIQGSSANNVEASIPSPSRTQSQQDRDSAEVYKETEACVTEEKAANADKLTAWSSQPARGSSAAGSKGSGAPHDPVSIQGDMDADLPVAYRTRSHKDSGSVKMKTQATPTDPLQSTALPETTTRMSDDKAPSGDFSDDDRFYDPSPTHSNMEYFERGTKAFDSNASDNLVGKGSVESNAPDKPGNKKSWFGSALGSAVDNVKRLFSSKEQFIVHLVESGDWTTKEGFKTYKEAMEEFGKIHSDSIACQQLGKEVAKFLESPSDCDIVKLSFATRIWTLGGSVDDDRLLSSITSRLAVMDFRRGVPLRVLNGPFNGNEAWLKPQSVFRAFFQQMVNHSAICDGRNSDAFWVNVLYLWDRCGLLTRQDGRSSLDDIREILGEYFFQRQKKDLIPLLGKGRVQSYYLFMQKSILGFQRVLQQIKKEQEKEQEKEQNKRLYVVPGRLEPIVVHAMKNLVNELIVSPYDTPSTRKDWCVLFELLSRDMFSNYQLGSEIVKHWINMTSLRETKSFELYAALASGVKRNQYLVEFAICWVRSGIRQDLKADHDGPQLKDVRFLLQSTSLTLLLSEKLDIDAMLDFAERLVRSESKTFPTKLKLLSDIHARLGSNRWLNESQIVDLVQTATQPKPSGLILKELFEVAKEKPGIFASGSRENLAKEVANSIVRSIPWSDLNRELSVIRKIINAGSLQNDGSPFCSGLASCLREAVLKLCISMEEASKVCLQLSEDDSSLELAGWMFVTSFERWKPSSMADLSSESPSSLEAFFELIEKFCSNPELKRDTSQVRGCQEYVVGLLGDWLSSFGSDNITGKELRVGLSCSRRESWRLLAVRTSLDLPDEGRIQAKIREFEQCLESIDRSLTAPIDWDCSMSKLLQAFNCEEASSTESGSLFLKYKDSFAAQGDHEPTTSNSLYLLPLVQVRKDMAKAKEFRGEHEEALSVCAYFLQNRSSLFLGMLAVANEGMGSLSAEELKHSVESSVSQIRHLFGDSSNFRDIDCAVKTLSQSVVPPKTTSQADVLCLCEEECSVLLGYDAIGLTEQSTERFLIVALLSQLQEPLKSFVVCCEQFRFGIAQENHFTELKHFVEATYSTADVPVESCMESFHSLHRTLFPGSIGSSPGSQELRTQFNALLPVFELLGRLSEHSEVWRLAREMKWFGDEGLERFYSEHDNVTNVLLARAGAYSMSVLDSIAPTMRVISVIGGLRDEKKMVTLLKKLLANSDVQEWVDNDRFNDLSQVQSNLSLIRRWFCDGMDEVADILRVFDAVRSTGVYSIASDPSVVDGGDLVLKYTSDSQGARESKYMLGTELASFVQQMGMIQHEQETVSMAVERFLEQYHLINAASRNILSMHSIGFDKVDVELFTCTVGDSHMDEARRLLKQSEDFSVQCDAWLRFTRQTYPISLLFWMEELLEIYNLLTSGDSIQELVPVLSRLFPLSAANSDCKILTEALSSVKSGQDIADGKWGWLVAVSQFLEKVHESVGSPRARKVLPTDKSEMVLHTLSCDDDSKNETVQSILQQIYKDRLPEEFEVLDGFSPCSLEKLDVFLQRTKAFPDNTFVVINIEELSGSHQEAVLSFLSNRENESARIRLHCIQRKPTMLHTAPWVEGKTWGNDISVQTSGRAKELNKKWKDWIVDGMHLHSVTLVTSKTCGLGKTRYIRRKLSKARRHGAEVGAITIHEGSTVGTMARDLASKFSTSGTERALHVSVLSTPSDTDWLKAINSFFFSLLVLRVVHHPASSTSFRLGARKWRVFVELPSNDVEADASDESGNDWVRRHIPCLDICDVMKDRAQESKCAKTGTNVRRRRRRGKRERSVRDDDAWSSDGGSDSDGDEMTDLYHISDKARRVCTYLRAYENGTINRKFDPTSKRIVFVLDRSGSMMYPIDNGAGPTGLDVATNNAIGIFDSHIQCDDMVGVVMFHHEVQSAIGIQRVRDDAHKSELRSKLDGVRRDNEEDGGTSMFTALNFVLEELDNFEDETRGRGQADPTETWIVCLTDGQSADQDCILRPKLERSPPHLHIIVIGVNLSDVYSDKMRLLCNKYQPNNSQTKGFYVPSDSTTKSISESFRTVSNRIPVSQSFELDGRLSDSECRRHIRRHCPHSIAPDNMRLLNFWISFLYRRVKVFDSNKSFNYNETHENLGSSLMKTMLEEVERLIDRQHNYDWDAENHAQLIYDFTRPDAPEFRLLCTSPKLLDERVKANYEQLDLPGFFVPTEAQLQTRSTLDRYLSQAMNVPLHVDDDGTERLRCIDQNGFVLTLDFTVKLLNIHERVICGLPCILEGETGVSKTALTKMYSIIRNSSLSAQASMSTSSDLVDLEKEVEALGHQMSPGETPVLRMQSALQSAASATIGNETSLSRDIHQLILNKCARRSPIFEKVAGIYTGDSTTKTVVGMLDWFASSELCALFFDINIDSSLTEFDIKNCFEPIREIARRVKPINASVVVFLDEINTSSVMGLLKEITVDASIRGELLEENIVVIAACNPDRSHVLSDGGNPREKDLGREWASGHYQVVPLPPSMAQLKWSFGSLNRTQEKDFIFRRMELLDASIPPGLCMTMTELISASQEAIRGFASRNIAETLQRGEQQNSIQLEEEARLRAKSVVSLRDIQRVFSLYEFFMTRFALFNAVDYPLTQRRRNAVLLSIAVVYLLRLDSKSRSEFLALLQKLPGEQNESVHLLDVLSSSMDFVMRETTTPKGIAITRGLKENIFMTLVCSLSRTPLVIVGPPGCSKTLAVNIVGDNANGEDSPSTFYRTFARLSTFHYQCSKETTSPEIAAVFQKASHRQEKVDPRKNRCVVFMDEAGLPEEERESLKVLHYLLEGHMSMKAKVGFVAISNHVLDAAKTNRCVSLLREEPDEEEMLTIAEGVLFDAHGERPAANVDMDGKIMDSSLFARNLCASYIQLLRHADHSFGTFFGLRDFIYFLKAVKVASSTEAMKIRVSISDLLHSIERNFNGVERRALIDVALCFLVSLTGLPSHIIREKLVDSLRDPMDVISQALKSNQASGDLASRARFKLIIDCSDDDSIMRILSAKGLLDISKKSLHKISHMPEDVALERLRLISGVKFAALQGNVALLSQTESVNESFYDLFNQHFRTVKKGRNGEVSLFANIAVGGISRRSMVRPQFECILHVRESQLQEMPAPFLNRFEKFRLDVQDVLRAGWSKLGGMKKILQRSRGRTSQLASLLGERGLFGWVDGQSLDSIFVDLLPAWAMSACYDPHTQEMCSVDHGDSFAMCIAKLLRWITSANITNEEITQVAELACGFLAADQAHSLRQMLNADDQEASGIFADAVSALASGTDDTHGLAAASGSLVQMLVTLKAFTMVMQVATPESVFMNRHVLPSELIELYFSQEHFSLKRLLARAATRPDDSQASLIIAYTRTDPFVHSIPVQSAAQDTSFTDDDVREKIRGLVCDRDDRVAIEHLAALRSEAALRASVMSWVQRDDRQIFILVADMSGGHALDQVNYVRMCVEQSVAGTKGKTFLLLLHFPPSNSLLSSCYPVLFLGGWQHVYLDGVGQLGPSLEVSRWIELASNGRAESAQDKIETVTQVSNLVLRLLPRVLSHVATQHILYPKQVEKPGNTKTRDKSFSARYNFLKVILETRAGEHTVGEILCLKFARLWLESALEKTMNSASRGLCLGTTQMSVSMAIHSTMVETFDTYISMALMEMNHWRNLDILSPKLRTEEVETVFGMVLRDFPDPPFEELALHRQRSSTVKSLPPAAIISSDAFSVRFPFFFFVSSFIDEILEAAEASLKGATEGDVRVTQKQLLGCAMTLLEDTEGLETEDAVVDVNERKVGFNQKNDEFNQRKHVVRSVVEHVKATSQTENCLFTPYLCQLVEWKTGSSPDAIVLQWMRNRITEVQGDFNIIAIHCIVRSCEIEFTRVISCSTLAKAQFPSFWERTQTGESEVMVEQAARSRWAEMYFSRLLPYFENAVLDEKLSSAEWSTCFSVFLRHIRMISDIKALDDKHVIARLRVLSLFSMLIDSSATQAFQIALEHCYDTDSRKVRVTRPASCSLQDLFVLVSGDERLQQVFIQNFFSASQVAVTPVVHSEDFGFLVELIRSGHLGRSQQVALLLRSCLQFETRGATCRHMGLPIESLQLLNSYLSCEHLCSFSKEGKRVAVPHFIPTWLGSDVVEDGNISEYNEASVSGPGIFFSTYRHSFSCRLSTAIFEMFLNLLLSDAENLSSSDLLRLLMNDVEAETGVELSTQTKSLRLLASGATADRASLVGSPIAALIADVRVICFVAKVAFELSETSSVAALSGVYSEQGQLMLGQIMALPGTKFQDFFFSRILSLRGEGTLAQLFDSGGLLHGLTWCKKMVLGTQPSREGRENLLMQAEKMLAESTRDEEQKARDFKLCPGCGKMFAVHTRGCGQFVCGQDAHGVIGREVHGCGHGFQVDSAPPYVIDEEILAPLRAEVTKERARLAECSREALRWETARKMSVPVLRLSVLNRPGGHMVPASFVLDGRDKNDRRTKLLHILVDGSHFVEQLQILPDLVEVYVWVHSTFKHLVTKEKAMDTKLSELMSKQRLQRRFDKFHVNHMLGLWGRLTESFDQLLRELENKVFWDCQEIQIPFSSLSEAPLIAFLSEGAHPTDGCDFLFLLINEIITRYNGFVRRFTELQACGSAEMTGSTEMTTDQHHLHPKQIIAGSIGALTVSSMPLLSQSDLEIAALASWDVEEQSFDLEGLDRALRKAIDLQCLPPGILNPMDCLRERFAFRLEAETTHKAQGGKGTIFATTDGVYFARSEDYNLANDVHQNLESAGLLEGDHEIRRALGVNFRVLGDHGTIVKMLEGIRNLLRLWVTENDDGFPAVNVAICGTMGTNIEDLKRSSQAILGKLGFPELTAAQTELFLSLQPHQVVEAVNYLCYQLASEGYMFASLPLRMADPADGHQRDDIVKGLSALFAELGFDETLNALDEFVRDVLMFYEKQIREEAQSRSAATSLRQFLYDNNFCDEQDRVFALIPGSLSIRHYASLRQLLHQIRLSLFFHAPKKAESTGTGLVSNPSATDKWLAGHCWLALETEEDMEADESLGHWPDIFEESKVLWFEMQPENLETNGPQPENFSQQNGTDPVDDPMDTEEGEENRYAKVIQRWWRNQPRVENCDNMDFELLEGEEDVDIEAAGEGAGEVSSCGRVESGALGSSWTYENLYTESAASGCRTLYGTDEAEMVMRRWLNDNRLSQSVGDQLVKLGVRNLDDIRMVVDDEECEEMLDCLSKLDRLKLTRAVNGNRKRKRSTADPLSTSEGESMPPQPHANE